MRKRRESPTSPVRYGAVHPMFQDDSSKRGDPRHYSMVWDKQEPMYSSWRVHQPGVFIFFKDRFKTSEAAVHTHLWLVIAPDRPCHHCTAVGLFPGMAPRSAQGPRPALPYFRLEELGHLTPEHFPIQGQPDHGNSCYIGISVFTIVTLL